MWVNSISMNRMEHKGLLTVYNAFTTVLPYRYITYGKLGHFCLLWLPSSLLTSYANSATAKEAGGGTDVDVVDVAEVGEAVQRSRRWVWHR